MQFTNWHLHLMLISASLLNTWLKYTCGCGSVQLICWKCILLKCTLLLHVITSLFLNYSITVSFIHYDNHKMEEELENQQSLTHNMDHVCSLFSPNFLFQYCLPIGLFVIGQKLVNKRFNLDKPARNSLVNQRCIRPNACHNQKKTLLLFLQCK